MFIFIHKLLLSLLFLTLIILQSSVFSANYVVDVNHPKSVYWGQSFTITFSLATTVINSTNFQYVTPGTKLVNVNNHTAYQGFRYYWAVDKANITNTSLLIISFEGKVIGELSGYPGIVLYGYNFSLTNLDDQFGNYEILVSWSGSIWVDKLHGWPSPSITDLPIFASGNYTVIFMKSDNKAVCVYSIIINGSSYLIKYNTGVPWDSIEYAGIRTDIDTILPLKFYVIANGLMTSDMSAYYVVYVNDKEYATGYGSVGNVTLRLYSPAVINITYPKYRLYKVITVSFNNVANIKLQFPIIQITLITVTSLLTGLSIWREIIKRKT